MAIGIVMCLSRAGVFVALRMLYGSLSKIKEDNPLLFKKFTCVCRKMRFPEVIRPGRVGVVITINSVIASPLSHTHIPY